MSNDNNTPEGNIGKTNAKIARLLEHAVVRLPLADRIEMATNPGINFHYAGESIEFRSRTGKLIAIADRVWLGDDEDDSFDPEFIPTDDDVPDFPPDLST